MTTIPIFLTLYSGFTHAFETDHLLAVSNMVSTRNKTAKAIKDGMYWGLGHSSTILLMGIIFLVLKFQMAPSVFRYFEALVGLMLIVLGIYRILQWYKKRKPAFHVHAGGALHRHGRLHRLAGPGKQPSHLLAYLIGLVHGLAGSGALILIVMSQSASLAGGLAYLLIFGMGSVAGMVLAAGLFSLPFSKKILGNTIFQTALIFISALLCIGFGLLVMGENLL